MKSSNYSFYFKNPLNLGTLDHYTLIVDDIDKAVAFHSEILGFELLKIQNVNTGTVPEGEIDMLNYIFHLPGKKGSCIITKGLNDKTIFHNYIKKYGEGLHHIAFNVDDVNAAFEKLNNAGIKMTSDKVITDPLSGLKQCFISKDYSGYFVELIQRTKGAGDGRYINQNMLTLSKTMESIL